VQVSICRAKGLPQKFFIRPRAPCNGPLICPIYEYPVKAGPA